jgi:hypothetical protein
MRCLTLNECQQWRKKHCRRDEWKRQTTCVTPLKRLPWYTAVLVGQLQPFDRALLIIDQVVFKVPPELENLRRLAGEQRPVLEAPGHAFENDGEGFRATLAAALSGWIDLRALFSPSKHALRADHDEYTTFFTSSTGKVLEIRRALSKGSVRLVEYTAKSP